MPTEHQPAVADLATLLHLKSHSDRILALENRVAALEQVVAIIPAMEARSTRTEKILLELQAEMRRDAKNMGLKFDELLGLLKANMSSLDATVLRGDGHG